MNKHGRHLKVNTTGFAKVRPLKLEENSTVTFRICFVLHIQYMEVSCRVQKLVKEMMGATIICVGFFIFSRKSRIKQQTFSVCLVYKNIIFLT